MTTKKIVIEGNEYGATVTSEYFDHDLCEEFNSKQEALDWLKDVRTLQVYERAPKLTKVNI